MVYVVFFTVIQVRIQPFYVWVIMIFCFQFNIKISLISSKIGLWIKLFFQKATFLTFHLANQLVSFKLAIEQPTQSLSANKLICIQGASSFHWDYKCQQDNCIYRKTNYYCQLCGAHTASCVVLRLSWTASIWGHAITKIL